MEGVGCSPFSTLPISPLGPSVGLPLPAAPLLVAILVSTGEREEQASSPVLAPSQPAHQQLWLA